MALRLIKAPERFLNKLIRNIVRYVVEAVSGAAWNQRRRPSLRRRLSGRGRFADDASLPQTVKSSYGPVFFHQLRYHAFAPVLTDGRSLARWSKCGWWRREVFTRTASGFRPLGRYHDQRRFSFRRFSRRGTLRNVTQFTAAVVVVVRRLFADAVGAFARWSP